MRKERKHLSEREIQKEGKKSKRIKERESKVRLRKAIEHRQMRKTHKERESKGEERRIIKEEENTQIKRY